MPAVNPYINFPGTCFEAFNFYKAALGGEFTTVMRFGDAPSEYPTPDHVKQMIMHISLPVGDTSIMGSDFVEGFSPNVAIGNNFAVSMNADSEENATRIFNALAEGG